MARRISTKTLVCDFETTVYEGQKTTEVWASATVEIGTEDVKIFGSIDDTFDYLVSLNQNLICYYHNLKFDGSFWLSYLAVTLGWEQASTTMQIGDETKVIWDKDRFMRNKTFKYTISAMGQWYCITLKVNNHIIEFRDSMKLLPFSVRRIGQSFKTKHKKLDMEYTGFRYPGCNITEEEKQYIANDVLVVKEALEIMFEEGHNRLTIGTCCLSEYKRIVTEEQYDRWFPDMYKIPLDETVHGVKNAGEWIRKSYKGGWCYLAKGKENKRYYNGTTADVNSLYPSMMSSESGNVFPVGTPTFWVGSEIPHEAKRPNTYYFIRIRTRFYLRKNYLPFVQIKNNIRYRSNECLECSDRYNHAKQRYEAQEEHEDGSISLIKVELTLTMTDYELLKEHYILKDCEILDGCYFRAYSGIFDDYMEKYKKIKMESKGALRELAKLFLNNLYGKMASSPDSSFKVAYVKPDKSIGFNQVTAHDKTPGYIPVGSAITSYARNFTIRAAQKNYHGVNSRGFIYADTDSIHCDLKPEEIVGIKVHDRDFCCWKLESCWDEAYFTRQKTYIEHITHENLEPIENPYYNIKCAGMPDPCKDLFAKSMEGYEPTDEDDYTDEEIEVIKKRYTMDDFKVGLSLPGKLLPKRIPGGVLLTETYYEMR